MSARMPGSFVFGDNWLGNGLGDATYFAASCLHRPGELSAPDTANFNLDGRYRGGEGGEFVPHLALSDLEDLNAKVDWNEPDACWIVKMDNLDELLAVSPAFCEGEGKPRSGEALFCARPRSPKYVSCGSSAVYARVGSQVKQTLKIQHYSDGRPVPGESGGEETPSGFYSFWGGCEVFLGEVTCFGGNGAFGMLPYGHTCGGLSGLANPLALSCESGSSPVDCSSIVADDPKGGKDWDEKQQRESATQPGLPPPLSPGVFVFGENWLGNGLGDAAFFAASCMHNPGVLTAPDAVESDYPGISRLVLSDLDDLNAQVDFTTPDLCWVVRMENIRGFLDVPTTCEDGNGGDVGGAGEALFCNRPLGPRLVDCGGSAMYARVGSDVDQTLKVEHYVSRPDPSSNAGSSVPSDFHSFSGGCEVFLDEITCFGGNGQFGALPFDHRCYGGGVDETLKLSCAAGSKPLECEDGAFLNDSAGDGGSGHSNPEENGTDSNVDKGSADSGGNGSGSNTTLQDPNINESSGENDSGSNTTLQDPKNELSGATSMTVSSKVQVMFLFLCMGVCFL